GRPVRGVAVGARLVAVAADSGVLDLWRPDGAPVAALALGGTPSGAPVLAGDGRVVVPLRSGQVVAFDGLARAWRARVAGAPVGPLAVASAGAANARAPGRSGAAAGWRRRAGRGAPPRRAAAPVA